jgi:hypothetical protein
MSALSSVSSFTSVPVNVPGCDAWGSFTVGSPGNVTLLDGYGISGVTRASTGIFGISFSNPERFGGGAYVVLATPEFAVDTGYGPIAVRSPGGFGVGGASAAGLSGGIQVLTYTYPEGFHTGGGTASVNDPQTGAVRVNLAAFSFATESDLRVPAVGNYIRGSEDLNNSSWALLFGGIGSAPIINNTNSTSPIGTLTAASITVNAVNISSSSNYSLIYQPTSPLSWARGKPWTWSFWAKGLMGGEKIVVVGSSNSSNTLITLTKEWTRYSGTETSSNTVPVLFVGTAGGAGSDVSSTFYVWGFQHEPGSIASDYVKTEGTVPVIGNQDARKRLVPGAGGLGVDGNTYASTPYKNFDKRRAVAYGTIVIPGNKGNSSLVSAYIENGFNVKSVSAGGNSRYDISFVQPMANDTYCVILSGEYESTDYIPLPEEYTLLSVRAGTGNKYKTPNGFRVEELRQYTVDNSWIEQSVRYQRGFTQRIHFMVFGEFVQGQSWFTSNPNISRLSAPAGPEDYNVWLSSWFDPDYGYTVNTGTAVAKTTYDAYSLLESQTAIQAGNFGVVPLLITYDSTNSPNNNRWKDLGHTGSTQQLINRAIDRWKTIPKSRRAWYPRHLPPVMISPQDGNKSTWHPFHSNQQYWAQGPDGVSYGSGWNGYGSTAALTTAVHGPSLSERMFLPADNSLLLKYWDNGVQATPFNFPAARTALGGYTGMALGAAVSVGDVGITLTFSQGWTLQFCDMIFGLTGGVGCTFYVGDSSTNTTYGVTANAGESKFVLVRGMDSNATAPIAFNLGGSTFDVVKRVVVPGATLVGGRKLMGIFPDKQSEFIQTMFSDFLDRIGTGVVTDRTGYTPTPVEISYVFDDHEDLDYMGMYYLGAGRGIPRKIVSRSTGYTGWSGTPQGVSASFLYDDLGFSAGYTGYVNSADPDYLRAIVTDPRVTTYKFDPNGVTTDSSPTLNSRFLDIYNRLVTVYGKGRAPSGATPGSLAEAMEWAYLTGRAYSSGASFGRLPSGSSEYLSSAYVGGGGRGRDNLASYYIQTAFDAALWELLDSHYRVLGYKPALDRGIVVGNYQQWYSTVEDAMYSPTANFAPGLRMPTGSRLLVQPNFYGAIGNYDGAGAAYNIGNHGCYVANPQNDVERYYFGGATAFDLEPSYDYNPPAGTKRFFHKTALKGAAAYNAVGVTLSPVSGLSAAAAYSATDTGITAWKGFTYRAGDILTINGKEIAISSYITGGNLGVGGKVYVRLHDTVGSSGVEGNSFHVYQAYNNPGFLSFLKDLRQLRVIQRATPDLHTRFSPWITSPHWTTFGYKGDRRYWWEMCYHLYLAGAGPFVQWCDGSSNATPYRLESPTTRAQKDGDMATMQRMLDNIRNISGNSKCGKGVVQTIQPLGDTVYVSGSKLLSGANEGMYLWRITVRPGSPGERLVLQQNTRKDIPDTLIINDVVTTESPHGQRGVWLLTKSAVPPAYTLV